MFFSAMKPDQETSLAVAKRDPLLGRRWRRIHVHRLMANRFLDVSDGSAVCWVYVRVFFCIRFTESLSDRFLHSFSDSRCHPRVVGSPMWNWIRMIIQKRRGWPGTWFDERVGRLRASYSVNFLFIACVPLTEAVAAGPWSVWPSASKGKSGHRSNARGKKTSRLCSRFCARSAAASAPWRTLLRCGYGRERDRRGHRDGKAQEKDFRVVVFTHLPVPQSMDYFSLATWCTGWSGPTRRKLALLPATGHSAFLRALHRVLLRCFNSQLEAAIKNRYANWPQCPFVSLWNITELLSLSSSRLLWILDLKRSVSVTMDTIGWLWRRWDASGARSDKLLRYRTVFPPFMRKLRTHLLCRNIQPTTWK